MTIVDSLDALVSTAPDELPHYLVPRADVSPHLTDDAVLAARCAPDRPDHVAIAWAAADRWLAEDEEIVGHARDPRHRVDALRTGRRVDVTFDGSLLASSDHAVMLVETDADVRYFLPRVHVFADLRRSTTETASPYLGVATHWTMEIEDVRRDVAVSYETPRPEVAVLERLLTFDAGVTNLNVTDARRAGGGHGVPG